MARPSQQEIIAKFVGFISERTTEAKNMPQEVTNDRKKMIVMSLAISINAYRDGISAAIGEKVFHPIYWSDEVQEALSQFRDVYLTYF